MGILKILVQVKGLASVTKNVKGKSSTFWGGLSVSFVGYWLLEKTALLPEGTTEFMENSNLEGWHLFVAWALIVFFISRDSLKQFFISYLTPNGRRDALNEALKEEKESLEYKVAIAKLKKELEEAEEELNKNKKE